LARSWERGAVSRPVLLLEVGVPLLVLLALLVVRSQGMAEALGIPGLLGTAHAHS